MDDVKPEPQSLTTDDDDEEQNSPVTVTESAGGVDVASQGRALRLTTSRKWLILLVLVVFIVLIVVLATGIVKVG